MKQHRFRDHTLKHYTFLPSLKNFNIQKEFCLILLNLLYTQEKVLNAYFTYPLIKSIFRNLTGFTIIMK